MAAYRQPAIYAATGMILGALAPVSAFAIRLVFLSSVRSAPMADFVNNEFFYTYQLIGSSIVFSIAGWIAGGRAERLRRAESFYHTLSEHDPLTGLYNARAFQDRYARSLDRAGKTGEPLSLLIVDVDLLKQINDRHGHITGNEALVQVANVVRGCKRAEDWAARWGGDEFAVLLHGADAAAARRVAENILDAVRRQRLRIPAGHSALTVTIGVCTARRIRRGEDLFAAADRALYEGKQAGRDRISAVEIGDGRGQVCDP
ncbi:MAG TPA: GGDEF domain-containing protein [Thermoanaerobaculia bacterium]|nr:GGDEF domain-containing protein [Thermoanaerobaculia bacterium]